MDVHGLKQKPTFTTQRPVFGKSSELHRSGLSSVRNKRPANMGTITHENY